MLLVKINTRLCVKYSPVIACSRRSQSVVSPEPNAIVPTTAKYPPIEDVSFKARYRKYRDNWHKSIQQLKTVEEKMIKINMPRLYGFKCMIYEEGNIIYNELPHVQFITRTHLANEPGLPSYYDSVIGSEKLNNLVEEMKILIEDGVAFELSHFKPMYEKTHELLDTRQEIDDTHGDIVSKQVNRIMLASLAKEYPHLLAAQVDFQPRIEAFWFTGGIVPSKWVTLGRKARYWGEILDEPIDKPMQYIGKPSLQVRHHLPLKEILPMAECENPEWQLPIAKYDPRTIGHCMKRRYGTTIPGFWPGDSCEFGLVSYHKRGYLYRRPQSVDDDLDALKTQSILANYSWLLGQASHLGFSTFNDVTYPLVNQSIITNGQFWSFCVYQLNTTLVNGWHSVTNPKKNICWITEPLKLFDKIENGKLMGFNDEVLKNLIKFYVNVPEERIGVDLRPYLDNKVPTIANIENDEKRNWLENMYKYLMSNRPRHFLMPELYHWEIVYKHMFKTRPMDKKRTPWDFGKNPLLRTLDQVSPKYIPKILRQDKHKKDKFEKTYFP